MSSLNSLSRTIYRDLLVHHFQNPVVALLGTVTTTTTASTSGGGGGGGGGVTSSENFTNIEKYESQDKNIAIGAVSINFSTLDIVKEVRFDAKTNEGWVTAKAELLKGRPSLATSDAPGTVYKYFNIWLGTSGYGESSKIENTYVTFSVPDDWAKNNKIESVKLMKLKDNSWVDINTEKISANTYKAQTMGFSSFAIVVSGAVSQTATTTPEVTATETGTPGVTGAPSESAPPVNFTLIIGLIVIIAIVVVVFAKRKEIFKKDKSK